MGGPFRQLINLLQCLHIRQKHQTEESIKQNQNSIGTGEQFWFEQGVALDTSHKG
jgi:hypothetical protein